MCAMKAAFMGGTIRVWVLLHLNAVSDSYENCVNCMQT